MATNFMGKTRKYDQPYLIFAGSGFEWRVLKSYQIDNRKPYARWFCAVKGPGTHGGYDLGDTYVAEIVRYGRVTYADPQLPPEILRSW